MVDWLWFHWIPVGMEILGVPVHLLVLSVVLLSPRHFRSSFFVLYKSNGTVGNAGRDIPAFFTIVAQITASACMRPATFLGLPLQWIWVGDWCYAATSIPFVGQYFGWFIEKIIYFQEILLLR